MDAAKEAWEKAVESKNSLRKIFAALKGPKGRKEVNAKAQRLQDQVVHDSDALRNEIAGALERHLNRGNG